MLTLVILINGIAGIYGQCNSFCDSYDWFNCDGEPSVEYHCDHTFIDGDACIDFSSLCDACATPCQRSNWDDSTGDDWFNTHLKCKEDICTEAPTRSPIMPGTPTSLPTPTPTHTCASFDCNNCELSPSDSLFCEIESAYDCTNANTICGACCLAQDITTLSSYRFTPTETIFDTFCHNGQCPTPTPTKTPSEQPTETSTAPSVTPTAVTLAPTPALSHLLTIWSQAMEGESVDLTHWTVTNTQYVYYENNNDNGCPIGSTSCWSLCSDNWNTEMPETMYRTAVTKGFEHIAFTFSIDPWSMYSEYGEYCELSYSIDDVNWTPFGEQYDSTHHIVDEIIFLDQETWDNTVSIKISAHDGTKVGTSCCYLSNLELSGIPIATTYDPTFNPTFNPTFEPTVVPSFNPSIDGEGDSEVIEASSNTEDNGSIDDNDNDDQQNALLNGDIMMPLVIVAGVCLCIVLILVVLCKSKKGKETHDADVDNMIPDIIGGTTPVARDAHIALPMSNDTAPNVTAENSNNMVNNEDVMELAAVTLGGPVLAKTEADTDKTILVPATLGAVDATYVNDAATDSDSDNDVIGGMPTTLGRPTAMQSSDDEDAIVPPPPLPPTVTPWKFNETQ